MFLAFLLLAPWVRPQLERELPRWLHNCVAHPLLCFCPPLGERLHDWTAARM